MRVKEAIASISSGSSLEEKEAYSVMTEIMEGMATDSQVAALITALCMKGETEKEITGFAKAIRAKASPVSVNGMKLADTCGTGGDMLHTYNVSTTVAFIVASCGVAVAKHGNRAVSSNCGSADVLEALGVNVELPPPAAVRCLEETGIAFLFAPTYHSAMKHAVKARKEIGIRTVFNLLGPLVNPAGVQVQLIGVYAPELTEIIGQVLMRLGVKSALVVHGEGGMDEISTLGPTKVTEVRAEAMKTYYLDPEKLGLRKAFQEDFRGGNLKENADITVQILKGLPGPKLELALINAAAVLYAADRAPDLAEGIVMAREAVYSGLALKKLDALRQFTARYSGEEEKAEPRFSSA